MTELTVATINLRHGADRWRHRRHLLVAQLVDTQPDLISLQEISFPIGQGHWLRRQINLRLSGQVDQPYRLIQKRKRHLIKGYYEGIGILSRLPILYHDTCSLGYGGRLALRAHIELTSRQVADFVATHFHHPPQDQEARLEQAMWLTGWLRTRRPVPYQIIAGDFNELPTGPAIRYLKQSFHSAYELAHGHEPLATFPTALVQPPLDWAGCLDYIFLSPAITQVSQARIFCDQPHPDDDTLYPSDHVGLIARLTFVGRDG
ncbi:MAG: endonuclease/exonuclease/phosphatase family protein [Chloroflexota bacterium]